jgi:hypothetical protein
MDIQIPGLRGFPGGGGRVGAGNEIRRSEKRLLGMLGLWRSLSESGAKNSATVRLLQLAEKVSRLRRVGTGQRLESKVGL